MRRAEPWEAYWAVVMGLRVRPERPGVRRGAAIAAGPGRWSIYDEYVTREEGRDVGRGVEEARD